jgi:hypothetical protein
LNGTVTVRGQERAHSPIPSTPRRQMTDPCNKALSYRKERREIHEFYLKVVLGVGSVITGIGGTVIGIIAFLKK